MRRSEKLSAAAATRTRSSPLEGPRGARSTSSRRSGPPCAAMLHAFIVTSYTSDSRRRTMKYRLHLALAALLAFSVAAQAQQKRIAVTMIVEVPQLLDVKRGLLEELARIGYREGQKLSVD